MKQDGAEVCKEKGNLVPFAEAWNTEDLSTLQFCIFDPKNGDFGQKRSAGYVCISVDIGSPVKKFFIVCILYSKKTLIVFF